MQNGKVAKMLRHDEIYTATIFFIVIKATFKKYFTTLTLTKSFINLNYIQFLFFVFTLAKGNVTRGDEAS